jgi:outer membrane receptor protein involved in Fe transport
MRNILKFTLSHIVIIFTITQIAFSQNLKLSGVVIDDKTRDPLAGANVYLLDAAVGTTTDNDGYFKLDLDNKNVADSMVVTYLGYKSYKIRVSEITDNMIIELLPEILRSDKGITVYAEKLDLARQELPHTNNVIKVEEIERYGTSEISDLFKIDPAVRIEGNDLDGRYIQIRGSDADEVNVYVDGILINSLGNNNAADISLISPDNIEKMEILKGSNLVLLGSGAFGGVVNITTRKKTETEYAVKLKYGTSNNRFLAADVNIPLNDRFFLNYFGNLGTISPEIEYYQSERFDDNKSETTQAKTIRQNHHFSLDYFTDSGQYTAKVLGYLMDYEKPEWTTKRKNMMLAGSYKGAILAVEDFDFILNYLYGDDMVDRASAATANFKTSFTTQRINMRLAKNFAHASMETTNFGAQLLAEYFHDELLSKRQLIDVNRTSTLYDAFLYDNRLSLGGVLSVGDKLDSLGEVTWKLFGGIRGEFLATGENYKISSYGMQIDFNKERWRLTPYLNYGENIKFPTLLDNAYLIEVRDLSLANNSLEPVSLQPELSQSREVGIKFNYRPYTTFYQDMDIQLAYFTSDISNKLLKRPLEDVILETQVGVNQTSGFEGIIKWNRVFTRINFSLSYGRFDVSNPLIYAYKPDEKYSFGVDYNTISGFYIMGLIYHEGKSIAWDYNDQSELVTAEVAPFYDFDISTGYKFRFEYFDLKIFLAGYNILDNAGYRFYNLKKRFVQAGIGITY